MISDKNVLPERKQRFVLECYDYRSNPEIVKKCGGVFFGDASERASSHCLRPSFLSAKCTELDIVPVIISPCKKGHHILKSFRIEH